MVSSCNSRKHCVLEICSEFIRESLVVFRRKNMPVSSKKDLSWKIPARYPSAKAHRRKQLSISLSIT